MRGINGLLLRPWNSACIYWDKIMLKKGTSDKSLKGKIVEKLAIMSL